MNTFHNTSLPFPSNTLIPLLLKFSEVVLKVLCECLFKLGSKTVNAAAGTVQHKGILVCPHPPYLLAQHRATSGSYPMPKN